MLHISFRTTDWQGSRRNFVKKTIVIFCDHAYKPEIKLPSVKPMTLMDNCILIHYRMYIPIYAVTSMTLRWRHNGRDSVSNHQPHHFLLNRLFGRRSKKTSKLRVTGLCAGNSPVTGEFPAQRASNAENVSIWWRHHVSPKFKPKPIQMGIRNEEVNR